MGEIKYKINSITANVGNENKILSETAFIVEIIDRYLMYMLRFRIKRWKGFCFVIYIYIYHNDFYCFCYWYIKFNSLYFMF